MSSSGIQVDLLVIGAGLAGLRAARQGVLAGLRTAIAWTGSGASPHVLAYNALAGDRGDSAGAYRADMLDAGGGLNHPGLAGLLVSESKTLNQSLEGSGFIPDRDEQGAYLRRHLGGCSFPRSFYAGDSTGADLVQMLWKELRAHHILELAGTELLAPVLYDGKVAGAIGIDASGEMTVIQAGAVVLACGGVGSLVEGSTYPREVKAGYAAFALLAGAELVDMEFLQFEPLVCFTHPAIDRMEIPTAMLGDGAVLRNRYGDRFMLAQGYTREAGVEKAALARSIDVEIREGRGSPRGGVYVDATGVPASVLERYHIRIMRLAKADINLTKDLAEVRPTAHSHMGGVQVDSACASRIPGLYAGGEAVGGLHGASRIAGNSGTDALITGDIAGKNASLYAQTVLQTDSIQWEQAVSHSLLRAAKIAGSIRWREKDLIPETGELLHKSCGLIRNGPCLTEALVSLERLRGADYTGFHSGEELRRMLTALGAYDAAYCMISAALLRKESRGAHWRSDFPEVDARWGKSIFYAMREDGQLTFCCKRNCDNQK